MCLYSMYKRKSRLDTTGAIDIEYGATLQYEGRRDGAGSLVSRGSGLI